MSFSIPVSALLLYPILYLLPLNLVRFRWGFEQGLAPMPPEVQEKAEAADRVVLCVTHIILLTVVVLLMYGSPISAYEAGLTADNWKRALGMGILFSLFPLGLSELVLRNMPPEKVREEPESHGPVTVGHHINCRGRIWDPTLTDQRRKRAWLGYVRRSGWLSFCQYRFSAVSFNDGSYCDGSSPLPSQARILFE